ncbi:MAG TPA: hypothetical protein VLJ80_15070 [Solirubrobacteraceae bacterium]|nr:hypothetical protein [Solirubrobacteraceae bacterium]
MREDVLVPYVERFFAERVFGPMRMDLLREQLTAEGENHAAAAKTEHARLARRLVEIDSAVAAQIRG